MLTHFSVCDIIVVTQGFFFGRSLPRILVGVLVPDVFKVVVISLTSNSSLTSMPLVRSGANLTLSFALKTSATSGPALCF